MPIIHGDPDFLAHYGVLGMKWGVRRYQNEDGSLTEAGKAHYRTDSKAGRVGRALFNGLSGQRLAVKLNKGYRTEKKEIKAERDRQKADIKANTSGDERKAKLKQLKSDYKKTLTEAKMNTARSIFSGQSDEENRRIQSQSVAQMLFKNSLFGDYGALNYERARAQGTGKFKSAVNAVLANVANSVIGNVVSISDSVYRAQKLKTIGPSKNDKE